MLPSDRYIASILGLTDEQYLAWKDYVDDRARRGPQPAVVAGTETATTLAIVSLVLTVIGVGFQIVAFLLAPRGDQRPADLKAKRRTGANQIENSSFAPRAGFDAIQEVAAIGEPIPVIYAKRETIGGYTYGGVRANTSLLWSQIWSLGGSQLLRGVFMIGEGEIESIDPTGFAIGDNTIGSYDLITEPANSGGSRLTIYSRKNGGRILSSDRIVGRSAAKDIGNAENSLADDVFQLQSVDNLWAPDFSSSIKPSTSTAFGVYSLIGNNLGYRLNPVVRPKYNARLKPKGDEGDAIVACDIDEVAAVQRAKYEATFSTRSGIVTPDGGPETYAIGDTVTYKLYRSSDFDTEFSGLDAENDIWTTDAEVRDYDGVYDRTSASGIFPGFSALVNKSNLEAAILLGSPTVDAINKKVTVDATATISTFATLYENSNPGTYNVDYWIKANNESRALELELKLRIQVTVREFRSYEGSGSGDADDGDNYGTDTTGITLLINNGLISTEIDIQMKVPEDSGPVSVLTSPSRLSAPMVFDYTKKDVYTEKADDAASAVAARQKVWDDAIVVGDIYKIGSALAVCTLRSPDDAIFISDFETQEAESGQEITATFEIVRAGQAASYTQASLESPGTVSVSRAVGSSGPHILRIAIANIITSRECRIVELGIRSVMGISITGLLRFRSTLTFEEADSRACLSREGDKIKRGNTVKVDQYQSGTATTIEPRFSFFRISFRSYSGTDFTQLDQCFGVSGITQQAMFNYIRIQMPSQGRWEFRIEPLTAWEIRESIATGELCVIDSKLKSVLTKTTSTGIGTISATFSGYTLARVRSNFRLAQTRRDAEMGLPFADTNNYADAWGRLAEAFIYEEIDASVSNSPEHEIVYVNEIVENAGLPTYPGIAIIGLNIRSSFEWSQFRQLSAYVSAGAKVRRVLDGLSIGASHLFPDVALDRLTNSKYGPGRITDDLIDFQSFQDSAQWCQDRRYFFDGPVMLATDSPRQWIADTAATMLLNFREVNGSYSLAPAISFSPVEIRGLFTAGNIESGSFKIETIPADERIPNRISVKWREERSGLSPSNPGLFPIEREVLVRESSTSDSAPTESVDLSDYVTSEAHAIDVAKFKLRSKRVKDHTISFTTTYDGIEIICSGIKPGDYIRVAMDATIYDEFTSGAIDSSGYVISTSPMSAGTYEVVAWDGTASDPFDTTIEVGENGMATLSSVVFIVKRTSSEVRTYEIVSISPTDDGKFDIVAIHSPTDESGRLVMIQDWDSETSWDIER